MKIYTKTGDKGQTGLVGGSRVDKDDQRIELYGTIDELNSFIGLLVSSLSDKKIEVLLHKIQSSLFDLGSNFACLADQRKKFNLKDIDSSLILELESAMDEMELTLSPLKNFVLPGGAISSSHAHVARTVCRRVERKIIGFEKKNGEEKVINSVLLINRLSDYLFVLARFCNKEEGIKDILWN